MKIIIDIVKKLISRKNELCLYIGVTSVLLVGCGPSQFNSKSAKAENSSLKAKNAMLKSQLNIVGSYKDSQNKAAITLNSNGTGRYVYVDPTATNTDDQLTWQKNTDNSYIIKLNDSNVTSPLIGKLSGKKLVLSGDNNWNTEIFNKTKGSFDLDEFLAKNDPKSNQQVSQSQINSNTTNTSTNNSNNHPKLADGTDVYSLPLADSRNPDSAKQRELMEIAGDPKYRNTDGSMNSEGRALSSRIQATFHHPE
ncbi:lipocalin/fatty acid-binding family protein [Limosilactobacillus albertensis]|uniref:DUF3642 domain-containing protein n=1 Tax=Limosilactobacillus albertensis TaxID=2759752 RepID=A0A839H0I8_9LACO|nr:lipocalin/fatty acid-binding family protein [Limosilactobacillus albertensis]MBB1123204.1 hypothetical protein [Limosilactobacillus albertensis]MCD7122890.1 lipocalin/fatty acid-binding family protein [Limosilactobacillus albertensis]